MALVLWGWRLGTKAISDNSAFVHLRTGLDMVSGHGIPRTDPYSFTALGEDWTVQSWLASWTYGWAERLGGFELLVVEQAVLMAVLAWLMARLARTGRALPTAAAAVTAIAVGSPFWVPRPLLFGLIGLALVVTVVERRASPWWLLPIFWMWVNSHGSFPLGLGWLVLWVGGSYLDRRRSSSAHRRRVQPISPVARSDHSAGAGPAAPWSRTGTVSYLGAGALGVALGAVSPLGWRLLVFPLTAWERRDVFRTLTEWRPPVVGQADTTVAFVAMAAAALLLVVAARRARVIRLADLLPMAVFGVAGFTAMRNLPMLAVVVAAPLGRAATDAFIAGRPAARRSTEGPAVSARGPNGALAGVMAVAFVVFGLAAWQGSGLELDDDRHAPAAVEWLAGSDLFASGSRIANDEVVGGWLVLRFGRAGPGVFIDDRFDMYPIALSHDLDVLRAGGEPSLNVLDRHNIDAVLWLRSRRLDDTLAEAGWIERYADVHFTVLERPA